jgi:hypothetical protein
MKLLKLKLLAVAVSLSAAGSAYAKIADGSTGNGELFLNVYDPVAQVSFVKDLGTFENDFLANSIAANTPGTHLFADLGADANWTSFLSKTSAANLAYNVIALDSTPTGQRYLSTSNDTLDTIQVTRNSNLKQFVSTDQYINAVNAIGTNPGPVSVNGSGTEVSSGPADFAYYGAFARSWGGNAKFDSMANVGEKLNFWQLGLNGTMNLAKIDATQYAGQWNLTQGGAVTYTVAAVPEPDAWVMLLAGALAVGAIVRRRRSV